MPLPCVEYVLSCCSFPSPKRLLIIQHLLRDTEEFVQQIRRIFHIVGIVGIPYSAKSDVVHQLKRDFVVIVPHNVEEMEDAIHWIFSRNSDPMFVLDVGGY